MEKKEFQKLFKTYMKELGYRSRKNICFMYPKPDYLVFVLLEHSSWQEAYHLEYGVVYEADQLTAPFSGRSDWSLNFLFTTDPSDDLARYPLDDLELRYGRELDICFNYSERTAEEFLRELELNVEKRLNQVYDREFALEHYRKNWVQFRKIPYDTVHKICRLAGLDEALVLKFRDGRYRNKGELLG